MTIKKQFFIFFALVIAAIQASHAAILVEPVVGFNLGARSNFDSYSDGSTTLASQEFSGGTGLSYGGRFGYQNFGFQVGLDYLASSLDFDDKDMKDDFNTTEWAAFVGFRFPILLRFYAGYIFSATADSKIVDGTGTTQDADFNGGSGFKAGLGWTVLPFVDLNLEYRNVAFDEWKSGGTKLPQDVDYRSFLLSVSLPFTF